MDYFEITNPKDKAMCLLVHGGEHILSIDENSPETDDKDADEYAVLIQKIEKIYIYPRNHGFMLVIDSIKRGKKQVRQSHNMKLNYDA